MVDTETTMTMGHETGDPIATSLDEEEEIRVTPPDVHKRYFLAKKSVPELLQARQVFGCTSSLPPYIRPRRIESSLLSFKVAWNPSRMQNMTLAVGPGTPAALVPLTPDPKTASAAPNNEQGDNEEVEEAHNDQDDGSSSSSSSEIEGEFSVGEQAEEEEEEVAEEEMEDQHVLGASESAQQTIQASSSSASSAASGASSSSLKKRAAHDMNLNDDDDSDDDSSDEEAAIDEDANAPKSRDSRTSNKKKKPLSQIEEARLVNQARRRKELQALREGGAVKKSDDKNVLPWSDVEKKADQNAATGNGDAKRYDETSKGNSGDDIEKNEEENNNADEDEDDLSPGGLSERAKCYLKVNAKALASAEDMNTSEEVEGDDDDDDENNDNDDQPRRGQRSSSTNEDGTNGGDDEGMTDFQEMATQGFAMDAEAQENDEESEGASDDDEEYESSEEDEEQESARLIIRRRLIRNRRLAEEDGYSDDDDEVERSSSRRRRRPTASIKPAMRHGGCINTAAWLDAGWRLSAVSTGWSSSFNSNTEAEDVFTSIAEHSGGCLTQLVTSGDDRLVKFWDVRQAMGSVNPLPGGRNTHCPFAHNSGISRSFVNYRQAWKSYYDERPYSHMSGNVLHLATLPTGHRGNVFHVTPLWKQPGKVATCGADGFLRLSDLEVASGDHTGNISTIIMSPEYDESADLMSGLFSLRPGMCFSHHMLNANVGLLCSERGLKRFDLRLPPRHQDRAAGIGGLRGSRMACKACAIWSVNSGASIEEVDSSYVFVGGSGADVALCDLRMTGRDSSSHGAKIIHHYRPRCLHKNADNVSVSGLDLSKDKKELLVSYESDQIYTFPIFPHAMSAAGPTLEEIGGIAFGDGDNEVDDCSDKMMNGTTESAHRSGAGDVVHELSGYGGHLNRFTFLKNARYAGPNDEYICTGSDSGHAWIYERKTGTVVSLLMADHSTCNGVIPHPLLPFFITYGIDSTAKLWRATTPIDPDTDDSPAGRARCFKESPYEMSPLTREWGDIKQEILSLEQEIAAADVAIDNDDDDDDDDDREKPSLLTDFKLLPDQVLSRKELVHSGSFGRRRIFSPGGSSGTRIANDLHNLPDVLRRNQYECIRATFGGGYGRRSDYPVEGDLEELLRRVSLIRLKHQADREGISAHWSPSIPWIMGPPNASTSGAAEVVTHSADLVPDNPSDWIPYDPEMTPEARACGLAFNVDVYGDFYGQRYLHSELGDDTTDGEQTGLSWIWPEAHSSRLTATANLQSDQDETKDTSQEPEAKDVQCSKSGRNATARQLLYETARVLKEGGNEALKEGNLCTAARRYDKALRYCAVAFIPQHAAKFFGAETDIEALERKISQKGLPGGLVSLATLQWSPLLKILVSTRLNLAMLLLKGRKLQKGQHPTPQTDVSQPDRAADQARCALRELQPFCIERGKVFLTMSRNTMRGESSTNLGSDSDHAKVLKTNEPEETFTEAKALQAKAFFRLGSAQFELGNFAEAVRSFEQSIESTAELDKSAKVDNLVLRRLAEAKRERKRKSKRHRKKFQELFGDGSEDKNKKYNARSKEKPTAVVVTPSTEPAGARDRSNAQTSRYLAR